MQKSIASLLGASLILLAACSGGTPSDDALPTLAQLPTALPSATVVPTDVVTASPVFTATAGETAVPTTMETQIPAEAATSIDAPDEPTATLLPDSSHASIFPTLVTGEDTILEGQMTVIDDTHATLTDSKGNTATVLIDPFAAETGANQRVRIHGTVEMEGDKMVLRMTEITVLNEATAEPEATSEAS